MGSNDSKFNYKFLKEFQNCVNYAILKHIETLDTFKTQGLQNKGNI